MHFKPEHARILVRDLDLVRRLADDELDLEYVYGKARLEAYTMLLDYAKHDDGEG